MKKQILIIACMLFLHISCAKNYCYICNTEKIIITSGGSVTQSNEPATLICDKTEDEKTNYETKNSRKITLENGTRVEWRTRCSRNE